MGDKVLWRMEQEQLLYNQHEDTASSSTSTTTSGSSDNTSRTRRPASSYYPTLEADGDEPSGGAKERSLDAKERKRRGGTVTGLVALDGGEEEREREREVVEVGEEASQRFQARSQHQLKRLSLRIREKLHLAFTSNNSSGEQPTRPARDSHYHQNSQSLPHSPKFLSTSEPAEQLQPAAQPLTSSRSSPSFSSSSSFFSPSNSPAGSTPTSPKGRRGLASSVSPRARQQQAVVPSRGEKEKKSQEEKKSKKKGGSRGHKARGGGSAAGDDRKTEDNSDSSNNNQKHKNNKNKKNKKEEKREGGNDDNDNDSRPSPRMQGGSSKRLGGMFHFSSRSKDKGGSLEEDAMMMATAATTSSPTRSRTMRKNEGGDEKTRKIVKSDEGKGGGKSSSPDLENRAAKRGVAKIGIRVEGSIDGEEEEREEGQDDLDGEEEGQYDEEKGWILPTTDIELLIEAFASASPLQGSSSGESTPVLGWVSKRPTSPRGGGEQLLLEVGSPKKKENMRLRLSASLSSFAFSPISSSKKQAPPTAGPESQSAQVKASSDAASAAGKKQKDGKFRFLHLQRSSAQLPLPSSAASASAPSLPTVDKESSSSSSSAHTLRSRTPSKEELKQIKLERKTAKKLEKLEKKNNNKRDSNGENNGGKKKRSSRRSNAGAGGAGSADKDSDGTRSITSSQEKSTDDDNDDGELGPVPSDSGCSLHTTFDEHQLLLVGAGASSPGLDELLEIEIAKLKEEEARRALRKQQEKLNKAAEQQHRQQREEAAAALVAKKSSERGELKTSTEWRSGRISPVPSTTTGEERTTVIRSGLRRSEEGAKKPAEPAAASNVQPVAEAVVATTTTTAAWQYDSSDEDELDEEHGWIDPARVVGSQLRLRGESTAAVRDLLESSGEDPYGERGAERGWIFPDEEMKCEGDDDEDEEEEEDDKKAWRKTTPPILVEPREHSGGPVFLMSKGANIFFRVQSQAQMGKIKKGADINNMGYMSLNGNRSSMLRNLKDQQDEKERVKLALLQFKARRGWSRSWENLTEAARGPIEANVVTIQTCARRFLAKRFRARLNVANELLLTEKSYVKALSVVVEVFYYPLLMQEPQLATTTASTTTTTPTSPPASAGGCRASTELQQQMRQTGGRVATIFSVADKLLFAHRTFCAILNERLRNLDEFRHKGLGDIFLKKTRFFDVYVKYINNYKSAIETLNRCKEEDPAMAKFIAECEAKKECGYMDLSSFLIQPVQRIPRYVLLLSQLLRKTTAGTKVHAELYRAVEKMRQATHHLNEQKRDAENAEYVAKLCSALVMPNSVQRQKRRRIASFDFSAERRFIKEGDVTLLASKFTPGKPLKKARSEELHLMLFNDVLLMCTRLHTSSRERRRSVRAALKSDDSMVGGPGGPNGGSSGSSDGDGGSGGGGGTLHRLLASIPGVVSPPSSRRPSLHSHASAASSSLPSSPPSAPLPVTQSTEFTSPPSSPQSYSPLTSPGLPVKYDIQEVVELWKVHVLDLPADTYGEGLVVVSTPLRSFVFAFGSAATKGEWMTALQSAVQRLFTSI